MFGCFVPVSNQGMLGLAPKTDDNESHCELSNPAGRVDSIAVDAGGNYGIPQLCDAIGG